MKSVRFNNIFSEEFLQYLHNHLVAKLLMICLAFCCLEIDARKREIEVDTAIFMREAMQLQEILVSPDNKPYSNKNNPAVDLVNKIRSDQKKGEPRLAENYSYDQYDKITMGLLDVSDELLRNHEALKVYIDSTYDGKRRMLKVLLSERVSTNIYSGNGKEHKEIERGRSSHGVNEMFDVGNIEEVLNDLLREVDIYDNDIKLMNHRFPSPLSAGGNLHYRYFIADTLDVEGIRCVQLTFIPRNPSDFVFSGNIFAEVGDSTGFIRKVTMKVPRTVNLNFVDNLQLEQTYEKDSVGKRHKVADRINLDICLMKETQSFHAGRISRYDNFSNEIRSDLLKDYRTAAPFVEIGNPDHSRGDLLTYMRGDDLSRAEFNMPTFMDRLRKYPVFYWGEKALVVLVTGYIKTGRRSRFDIGPINTLLSTNPVEKVRFRIGGTTTANLSPHIFASGYVAYGTHDRKWKYKAELEYSFYRKKYHRNEFPVNSIRATHMFDLDMIGQHYDFTNPDNVFLSLKRKKDMLVTYRHLTKLEYTLELNNHLSFSAWAQHIRQDASPWLPFITGEGRIVPYYRRSTIGTSFRYAPGEKIFLEKDSRTPINRDAPVVCFRQEWGPKGMRGCHYVICKTELSAWKRFWLSTFGQVDLLIKGGVVWSQVPYPELLWQNANLSYTIQPESYSLLNPMEFAMDRFVSADVTYWGNGVIFNRVPVIKKIGLREVVDFKYLWGGLSRRNNPEHNPSLFRFPEDADVRIMDSTPYMEISFGIDNIFKILRVDYVWRLSYLDTPGIDRGGLRVALHFNF